MTGNSESELVIRTLYAIAGEYDKGFEHQINRILDLGLKRFDLDIGILSNIRETDYTVVKQVSPADASLHDGDSFQLGNTYCSITMAANGPVGFEHVGQTDISTHPAYKSFGLEAYIGAPVYVKEEVYGTLNFSSPEARPRVFSKIDIDALQLMAAWVGGELSRRQTEQELKQAKEKLEWQSREDLLTHLYNRRGFEEKLVRLTRRNKFEGSDLIGMVVDIDDFKSVNDTHGHSIGDQVLEAVAGAICNSVRPNDICGRIGGDEFMVLLPVCSLTEALEFAERMCTTVNALQIEAKTAQITPSVSVGIGPVPANAETVTDALASIDSALQRAKELGKNAVSA